MSDLEVPPHETGVVRLFAVELPEAEVAGFAGKDWSGFDAADEAAEAPPWPLRDALGAEYLDEDFVEVFPARDVAALGLSGYLTEGMGLPEEEIAPDRERIDAVEGHVLVVGSAAFGGFAQSLDPQPPLRHIGTYRETPVHPVIGEIEAEAAKGRLARRSKHVVHHNASPLRTLLVVVVAMLLGAGIVMMLALGLG